MDECDVFSNENPDENDSASVSNIQEENRENETFYDEDSGYDSYYPFPSKIFALLYILFNSAYPLVFILIPDFEARFLIRVKKFFHLCGTYLKRLTYGHLLWHALKLLSFLVQDNLCRCVYSTGTVCNGSALFEGPF